MLFVELTEEEARMLCEFIEDEQTNGEYEHYWSEEYRKAFDEVLYKLNKALYRNQTKNIKEGGQE